MPSRSFLVKAGAPLVFLAGTLAMGEVGLRLLNRPFDPATFQSRNDAAWEGERIAGRLSFDERRFWRSGGNTAPRSVEPDEAVILLLADGDALASRDGSLPWPRLLEQLLDLNETTRKLRIVNRAQPGYSSLQARRLLEEHSGQLALVIVALGANDAHLVRIDDASYARRLGGLGRLSRSWLALRAFHRLWPLAAADAAVPRVPPERFETELEAIVAESREAGAELILLEPRAAAADYSRVLGRLAQRQRAPLLEAAADPLSRAEAVLGDLAARGWLRSGYRRSAELNLASGELALGLLAGWGPVERGADGRAGRRAAGEAGLELERRCDESGLLFDLTCDAASTTAIDVNGELVGHIEGCRGRRLVRFGLPAAPDPRLTVRLAAARGTESGPLVHAVRLSVSDEPLELARTSRVYASAVDPGDTSDARPELGPGWWSREVWSDGRRGRWTSREASLYLERAASEAGLLVEASLQNPANRTACRIEANGVPVYAFTSANGRHRYGVDIRRVPGRLVHVRFVVERTFVPAADAGRLGDERTLGVFVHSVRLAGSALP